MNSLEVANYIKENTNHSLKTAISFVEAELDMKFSVQEYQDKYLMQYQIYSDNQLIGMFYRNQVNDFVTQLWKLLTETQRNKLIEVIEKGFRRNNDLVKENLKEQNSINIINQNTANATNTNIIEIATLIDLAMYVAQSTEMQNKQEIQEIIKDFNEAEKGEDKDTYLGLLFKILDKPQDDTNLLPQWLANSMKVAKKFVK